jgi:hypothetical protein
MVASAAQPTTTALLVLVGELRKRHAAWEAEVEKTGELARWRDHRAPLWG